MKNISPELSSETDRLDPIVWKISSVVVLGSFLAQLDATVVNVSLSSLAVQLHSGLAAIQWVTSGYLLALTLMLPLNGWLVDRIGAKALYLWCFSAFTLSSALCAFSWSANSLIGFRVLQGMSGGSAGPDGAVDDGSPCGKAHGARDGLCRCADSVRADPRPGDCRRYSAIRFLALAFSGQSSGRRTGSRAGHSRSAQRS